MWKKIRKNYRRLIASLLTLAMVVTNAGGNLGTIFAAGETENALFLLEGRELREAIREAEEQGEVFDFSTLRLAAKRKSIKTRYEKLLGKKEGAVYALDLDIDDSYAPEGTELQVFYNAGTEDVIFLFLNGSDLVVDYRVNIDGYETEPVRVNPNTINIEADGEDAPAYAENYEASDMIDDEGKKLGAEVLNPTEESGEEEKGTGTGEAESKDDASEEETGDAVTGTEDQTKDESQTETNESNASEETEGTTAADDENAKGSDDAEKETPDEKEEGGNESEAGTGAEDVEETTAEAEEDREEEAAEAEETEAAAEAASDKEDADAEDGELLSISRHEAAIVAISIDELDGGEGKIEEETESFEDTEDEAEEETEAETETEDETEGETEPESKADESESETESDPADKAEENESGTETGNKPEEDVSGSEAESKSEEIEAGNEAGEKPEESEAGTEGKTEEDGTEIGGDITIEETDKNDSTEIPDEKDSSADADLDSDSSVGNDRIEMDGQLLEDDDIEILGELKGKEYDTVTILDHVNARAWKIALEDIEKIISSEAMDYVVEYQVNVPEAATVEGADSVAEGENLYFAVEPEEGYEIAGVYANGSEVEEVEDASELASASNWKGYSHVYVVEGVEEDLLIDVEVEELEKVIAAATYTAETEDAVFKVKVPDGAFTEEVELQVSKIEDADRVEELKAQANELLKDGQTVADILVYDVTFISKETGEEIEPIKAVSVSASMKAPVVSEETVEKNLSITEISVVHLPDEKEAEVVASTENAEETEFEFQTESFSEIMFLAMTNDEAGNGVAKIVSESGEVVYYETLQKAIDVIGGTGEDAQPQGAEIVLLSDVLENIKSEGKNYTLDMDAHEIKSAEMGVNIFTIKKGDVTIKNGTIREAHKNPEKYGNVRAIETNEANLSLENCKVTDNEQVGIYAVKGSLTLTNSAVSNNGDSGIYSDKCAVSIYGKGEFNNNKGSTGSSIYMWYANLTMDGTMGGTASHVIDVSHNELKNTGGGAIYVKNGETKLINVLTTHNAYASIKIENASQGITMENVEIAYNTSENSASALYVLTTGVMEAKNCKIHDNTVYGSVNGSTSFLDFIVALYSTGSRTFENCQFYNNKGNASRDAKGVVFVQRGTANFVDCSFTNNADFPKGSVIYGYYYNPAAATVNLKGGIISGNHTKYGAIYAYGYSSSVQPTVTMEGTVIRDNTATDANGGGVYMNRYSKFEMKSGAIYNNTPYDLYSTGMGNAPVVIEAADMTDPNLEETYFKDREYVWKKGSTTVKASEIYRSSGYVTMQSIMGKAVNTRTNETYNTLNAAVDAAKSGDTITLINPGTVEANRITADAQINVQNGKKITIDLNGFTVEATGTAASYSKYNNGLLRVGSKAVVTLTGEGTLCNKVFVGSDSTLNLNGNIKIQTMHSNEKNREGVPVICYGIVNVNNSMDSLKFYIGGGELNVKEGTSLGSLWLEANVYNSSMAYVKTVTIDGNVGSMELIQKCGVSVSSTTKGASAITVGGDIGTLVVEQDGMKNKTSDNTLTLNGQVGDMTLTQGSTSSGNSYGKKVIVNGPVGSLKATQGTAVEATTLLELNNTVESLTLQHFGSMYAPRKYPTTVAGENFFADSMMLIPAIPSREDVTKDMLVDTDENAVRSDIVMIRLPKNYDRAEELAANGDWCAPVVNNKPVTVVDGVDYNYLTKVAVGADGNIVLRKDHSVYVYLDPANGSDGNTGIAAGQPVQTLDKAIEVLKKEEKRLQEPVIYIKSALEVSSEMTLNEATFGVKDVKLQRYPAYKGALIKVTSGALTLGKITIDGGSEKGASAEAPLITVSRGATLNVTEGAVLQNNYNKFDRYTNTSTQASAGDEDKDNNQYEGGAIWNNGTLNMSEGDIQGNKAVGGSGVFTQGIFNFTGGRIKNNHGEGKFKNTQNGKTTYFGNAGGGVLVAHRTGIMNMSGDAEISGNTAKMGGGISLGNGHPVWYHSASLNMTGGKIEGNTATETNAYAGAFAGGGGINIQTGCSASISGGSITGNRCEGNRLGGGGIYVNGDDAYEKKYNIKAGQLYMTNVLISGNTGGAGVAVCEDGDMRVYLSDGGIIYGNTSSGKAYDLHAESYGGSHNNGGLIGGVQEKKGELYVSRYMLGGGEYFWRHIENDELATSGDLRSHIKGINVYSSAGERTGEDDIKVRITGNSSATTGSGVGGNGDIIIGSPTSEDRINITVKKTWNVDLQEVSSIDVYYDLWSKLTKDVTEGEVPSEANGWTYEDTIKRTIDYKDNRLDSPYWPDAVFSELPKADLASGEPLTYKVMEKVDADGRFICEGISQEADGNTFVIKNKLAYSLRLTKKVVDQYDSESIEEAKFKFTVTLKDANGKAYTNDNGVTNQKGDSVIFDENGTTSVELKAGEMVEFFGLTPGTAYTIEEEKNDEFDTTIKVDWGHGTSAVSNQLKGTIVSDTVQSFGVTKVEFTNATKEAHGSLNISKTVKGITGNTEKPWTFKIKLMKKNGEPLIADFGKHEYKFTYSKEMGSKQEIGSVKVAEDGTAVFYVKDSEEGIDSITLAHGQSVMIDGVPVGAKYLVTEEDANTGDYITTVTGEEGAIVKNQTQEVKFTNTEVGGLTVHKTVEGTDADTEKDWEFTVKLDLTDEEENSLLSGTEDADSFVTYKKYNGVLGTENEGILETGTIPVDKDTSKAEFTITLKHGEYVTINNLPTGTVYDVIEKEANTGSYVTTVNNSENQTNHNSGIIEIGAGKEIQVHFMNSLQKIDIEGKKVWDDVENQDGKRPQIITVNLYADGVLTNSVGVTSAGTDNNDQWNWRFSDLPRYKDGKEIVYTVAEEAVKDYSVHYSKAEDGTLIITNQYTPGQTSYTVEKKWEDNDNRDNLRPESITVQLMQNGTAMGPEVILNSGNNWTYEWKNLPQKLNGKDVEYKVAEIGTITGYTVSYNHTANITVITNTHTPDKPNKPGGGNPGGGNPGGPSGGNPPGGPGTTTTIDEPGVPLANLPPDSMTELIEDSEVPLAALPRTGDSRHTRALMMMFGIAGLGMLLTAAGLRRRKDESDD